MKIVVPRRLAALATLAALMQLASSAAMAQTAQAAQVAQPAPRSFAVVSEFAHEINVITFQATTGSRLDTNLRSRLPITDGALDKLALRLAQQAIAKTDPGAPIWLVAPLESNLFDPLGAYLEGSTVALPDDLAAEMKRRGCTHLLLIERLRAEADLKARNVRLGTGKLEGIGFYVDPFTEIQNTSTGETTPGFLAPFMHARLVLIDAASGRVLAMRQVLESRVIASTRGTGSGANVWDAITNKQKQTYLTETIQRGLAEDLPALLAH